MYKTLTDLEIPEKKDLELLKDGEDGELYRFDNYVIKFVKNNVLGDPFMSIPKVNYFVNCIKHDSLLTPINAVLLDKQYVGYITRYIEDLRLRSLSTKEFLNSCHNLSEVYEYLTEKGIWMHDVHGGNIIVNKKMHLIDLDRTQLVDKYDSPFLKYNNDREYQELIFDAIRWAMLEPFGIYEWERKEKFIWGETALPFSDWKYYTIHRDGALIDLFTEINAYDQMSDYIGNKTAYVLKKYKK